MSCHRPVEAVGILTKPKTPVKRGAKNPSGDKLLKQILARLDEDKAEAIVPINLHGQIGNG